MGFLLLTVYTSYVATSSMSETNKMITYVGAVLIFLIMLFGVIR